MSKVRTRIAFDSPHIDSGIVVYTPKPGDILTLGGFLVSIGTAWDGTTPTIHAGTPGDRTCYDNPLAGVTLSEADAETPGGRILKYAYPDGSATTIKFEDDTPLVVSVDDGSGGDSGSTRGEAEITVLIA